MSEEKTIWQDVPYEANLRGMRYTLTSQRVIVESGILSHKRNQLELVTIKRIDVFQSFGDKILGRGQVKIIGAYNNLDLSNVSNPQRIAEMIRTAMRDEKDAKVSYREIV